MKFTADVKALTAALRIVSRTTKKDDVKSCVKIVASKNGVDLFTSIGMAASCYSVPGVGRSSEGVAMVDCESMLRCVSQCEGDVDVSVKNSNLYLQCGKREYKIIMSADPAKLPFRDEFDSFDDYVFDLADMQAVIKLSAPLVDQIRRHDKRGLTMVPDGKTLRLGALGEVTGCITSIALESASAKPVTILPVPLAEYILALPAQNDLVGIGIDKTVVTFQHQYGYCYFAQLAGKPEEIARYDKIMSLRSGPVMVIAGILERGIKSVLVMGDTEDGDKGKLTGGKGVIKLMTHTPERGAARDEVIVAGDFSGESWYNLRALLKYVRGIDPETEIKISRAVKDKWAALVTEHDKTIHWLVNCEPPYADNRTEDASEKAVSKNRR